MNAEPRETVPAPPTPRGHPDVDVSAIVLNYGAPHHTVACVRSLLSLTSEDLCLQVVVVDNGSDEEGRTLLAALAEDDARVVVVESVVNLGFSGGHMLGYQYARGEYVFMVNSDCVLRNDAISTLRSFLVEHSEYGMVGPGLFTPEGEPSKSFGHLPSLTATFFGSRVAALFWPESFPERRSRRVEPIPVPMLSGCAMFFRREALDRMGGLDVGFFLYCEEYDIAVRLRRAGYEVGFVPAAEVAHEGGGSTGRELAFEREFYLSYGYFLDKHHSWLSSWVLWSVACLKEIGRALRKPSRWPLALGMLRRPGAEASLRHQQTCRVRSGGGRDG